MSQGGSHRPPMKIRRRSCGGQDGMREVKSFSGHVEKKLASKASGMESKPFLPRISEVLILSIVP
jgi:hypothetical protein